MVQDAFSIPWTNLFGYTFPPISIIYKVVSKVKTDKATVLLIAPTWPQRAWYAEVLNMLIQCPILIPTVPNILMQDGIVHPNPESLHLAAWMISGDVFKIEAFHRSLCQTSWKQERKELEKYTRHNGKFILAGAVKEIEIPFVRI
jgi:hypothetical protein